MCDEYIKSSLIMTTGSTLPGSKWFPGAEGQCLLGSTTLISLWCCTHNTEGLPSCKNRISTQNISIKGPMQYCEKKINHNILLCDCKLCYDVRHCSCKKIKNTIMHIKGHLFQQEKNIEGVVIGFHTIPIIQEANALIVSGNINWPLWYCEP